MTKHTLEWARKRLRGALNTTLDALARAIIADADEANPTNTEPSSNPYSFATKMPDRHGGAIQPAHPYYWRPWETRPERGKVLIRFASGAVMAGPADGPTTGRETHWMPLPPEPTDDS